MHLHFASDTLTFHSSLSSNLLASQDENTVRPPIPSTDKQSSYCGASPTRRVAKCRAPHDQLSPWPLKGIQPSAPLLSAMTAQTYRQTVGDEKTPTNKPINMLMIMCHGRTFSETNTFAFRCGSIRGRKMATMLVQ